MEKGLHGSHTLGSGLPTKVRIKTHHGAQKRHGAAHKGNETVSCPALNVVRDRRVGRPEKRGLRQREARPSDGDRVVRRSKKTTGPSA